ncbi:MAG: hypothetical protein U0Q12_09150 [Vicinamibacterales bacterium]
MLSPALFVLLVAVSLIGAVIGIEILTTLGVTPNTSLIGVIVAIGLAKTRLPWFGGLRSVHAQNLVQTAISSATFGAANSLLVPVGVPYLLGRPDLAAPMLAGAAAGMLIDLGMLYGLFDSRVFPAAAPWPHGRAAAEAILAGDEGGERRFVLSVGAIAGALGASGWLAPVTRGAIGVLPMSAFGVAFIGNVWALALFGLGLVGGAYAPRVVGLDLNGAYVPHGMMVGAGIAALAQAVRSMSRPEVAAAGPLPPTTRTARDVWRTLGTGLAVYILAGTLLALGSGLSQAMSGLSILAWVLFAAASCVAAQFIVGLSAMHAGWFPAFATSLIFLVIGLACGFPPVAVAVLVGFVASGGPAFADAGYDFKAGWELRSTASRDEEREGRRQQLLAGALGLLVALAMVAWLHGSYFARGLFPPVDRVYVATIQSGIDPALSTTLALWALPGAAIQFAGGSSRQIGILLSTGLLIANASAGWAVLAGLVIRAALERRRTAEAVLGIVGAGVIAGDAVWSATAALLRAATAYLVAR